MSTYIVSYHNTEHTYVLAVFDTEAAARTYAAEVYEVVRAETEKNPQVAVTEFEMNHGPRPSLDLFPY